MGYNMGGRGKSTLGKGQGIAVNELSKQDVWSFRHNKGNQAYVDAINSGVAKVQKDFPTLMDSVAECNV